MVRFRALAVLAMTSVVASKLSAQRVSSSVDLSGTGVWYADTVRSAGTSLAPSIRIDWPSATIAASASAARLGSGGSSVQGAFDGSVFTPSAGWLSGELATSLGGSSHHDGTRTGSALGAARAYATFNGIGSWGGVGAGSTWDGAVWRRVRQAEIGAWLERSGVTTTATINPVVVEDTIRYTDVQLALRYPKGVYELSLTAGMRGGSVGPEIGGSSRHWGSVSGLAWLSSRIALVANVGTYPVDFTQGYPGGRYIALSLRVASRGSRSSSSTTAASETLSVSRTVATGATSFSVRTVSDNRRTIRIDARDARTVEINGDFTRWQPMRLTRGADGSWSVTLPISRGAHQVNIRVDGGAWLAPPGLLTSKDEFGGVVGILVIE
ncbi:MAG TPA: glycogen-binding domain-containing protein [Gemmatimonadaceae bacterium]